MNLALSTNADTALHLSGEPGTGRTYCGYLGGHVTDSMTYVDCARCVAAWEVSHERQEAAAETTTPSPVIPRPRLLQTIQWCPSGNVMESIPDPIMLMLADEHGRTCGHGYGASGETVFGTAAGAIITVHPTQWVNRYDDGSVTVTDERPTTERSECCLCCIAADKRGDLDHSLGQECIYPTCDWCSSRAKLTATGTEDQR